LNEYSPAETISLRKQSRTEQRVYSRMLTLVAKELKRCKRINNPCRLLSCVLRTITKDVQSIITTKGSFTNLALSLEKKSLVKNWLSHPKESIYYYLVLSSKYVNTKSSADVSHSSSSSSFPPLTLLFAVLFHLGSKVT
jgi:hypothetical protein